jgi:hypothetical protein
MPKYRLIHNHNFGTTVYPIETDGFDFLETVTAEEEYAVSSLIARILGINFEPWKDSLDLILEEPQPPRIVSQEEWENALNEFRKENSRSF